MTRVDRGQAPRAMIGREGEHFVIVTADAEARSRPEWAPIREEELRSLLAGEDRSQEEIDEAIDLSREWATTVTR